MFKKSAISIVCSVLIFTSLACHLPFSNQVIDTSETDSNDGLVDGISESRPLGEFQVEITVPRSYIVGRSGVDLAPLVDVLGAEIGQEAALLQQLFQNNRDDILFWGYEPGSTALPSVSFVVFKNEEFAAMPLGIIAPFADALLGPNVIVEQQDRLSLGGRDTLRLITSSEKTGPDFYQVAYLFKESGNLFVVGFVAARSGIDGQMMIFNSIVSSLTVTTQ